MGIVFGLVCGGGALPFLAFFDGGAGGGL